MFLHVSVILSTGSAYRERGVVSLQMKVCLQRGVRLQRRGGGLAEPPKPEKRGYASYWNTFLFSECVHMTKDSTQSSLHDNIFLYNGLAKLDVQFLSLQ